MTDEVLVLDVRFAVHQLKSTDLVPAEVFRTPYYWIGRTEGFLSLICDESLSLPAADTSNGWRCLNIGTDDPVLPEAAQKLRNSGIGLVPLPSGAGAYGLVPERQLPEARRQLEAAGYRVTEQDGTGSA
ncbi:hypothetical protein ACMDCT_10475 [Halomonadaceae bacterium KBTZ08]